MTRNYSTLLDCTRILVPPSGTGGAAAWPLPAEIVQGCASHAQLVATEFNRVGTQIAS